MASSNRCKKFQANIFDKSKCQNCYRAKEQHCAEALECNRASRKISKCGYLFVAPEQFDFNSPLDKTRRWQRRFFVLYDDGELTYSVDENVSTVPQGVIDMNKCTDVFGAEELTTHALSIAVRTNERTVYIKGTSKEEIGRWHDVLVMYPRSCKAKKPRRQASLPAPQNKPPISVTKAPNSAAKPTFTRSIPESSAPHKTRTEAGAAPSRTTGRQNRRHSSHLGGQRHVEYRNGWSEEGLTRASRRSDTGLYHADNTYFLGMGFGLDAVRKKPSSANQNSGSFRQDISHSSEAEAAVYGATGGSAEKESVSNTGHRRSNSSEGLLDSVKDSNHSPLTFRGVRSMKHLKNDKTYQAGMRKASSLTDLTNVPGSEAGASHANSMFRSASGENLHGISRTGHKPEGPEGDRIFQLTAVPLQKTATGHPQTVLSHWTYKDGGGHGQDLSPDAASATGSDGYDDYFCRSPSPNNILLNCKNKNETDELKMAKSNRAAALQSRSDSSPKRDAQPYQDDLVYMKKGWLLRQEPGKDEWTKQWFVLSGTSLHFYRDAQAEELVEEDGSVDIASCYQVVITNVSRNYGFTLKSAYGDHILSAMTSGIRANWMQAIQKCIETSSRSMKKSSPRSFTDSDGESPRSVQSSSLYAERPKASISQYSPRHAEDRGAQGSSNNKNKPASTSNGSIDSHNQRRSRERTNSDKNNDGSRKFTCTWPYTSPSSSPTSDRSQDSRSRSTSRNQQPRSRSSSRNHSRRSSISDLIDDEEFGKIQRELTEAEERELDNVEVNIRRIHRKSITDSVAVSKLPHLSKFEQSGAERKETDHTYSKASRELFSTPHKSREQSPASRDRVSRSKSPSAKAPSAKLKDKSRSKSPKRRSPPPNLSTPVTDDYFDSLEKWKENRWERSTLLSPKKLEEETVKSSVSTEGQDSALVELLDSEVDSLRRQLEQTQSSLQEKEAHNALLKSHMESLQREHSSVITDIDADNDRYMGQLDDLQNEMDHATDYLKNRLVEQENRTGLTKIQVTSLKKEVMDAKDTIRKKKKVPRP